MNQQKQWLPKRNPWEPADYDDAVVYAVRAVKAGIANDGQQKLVWDWIMYVTGAGDEFADMSFRPGPTGDRDTTFAEGKRFAGLQMRKMLHPAVTPKDQPATDSKDKARHGSRRRNA